MFHHDLAPSPKECFAALERAACFGASSMGALRAAECRRFGFVPLGAIARWYAFETIDGDDEVALLTHPETHLALTVPMVNVRYVAWLARRRGLLSQASAESFIAQARDIFYMDRTWEDVLAVLPRERREPIAAIARTEGDLKRHDARFAVRSVARRLSLLHQG